MTPIDKVLKALTDADKAAAAAVSTADRLAGALGRGAPRWHRRRGLRLRIRAVNIEHRRPDKARALRIRAALHLAHAEAPGSARGELLELLAGREPLARSA